MRQRLDLCDGCPLRRCQSRRTSPSENAKSLAAKNLARIRIEFAQKQYQQSVKKERTTQETADLILAIEDARNLIYSACWKLIRAQDIIVDEKDTLYQLQMIVQDLRNYADRELTRIK
jgi:hypothetical protein